jgi:hypothetical protein
MDHDTGRPFVTQWIERLAAHRSSHPQAANKVLGYLGVLGAVYHKYMDDKAMEPRIREAIVLSLDVSLGIEIKMAALRSLRLGVLRLGRNGSSQGTTKSNPPLNTSIAQAIARCLNDYTTDRRGDVGSLVRIEAIASVRAAWKCGLLNKAPTRQALVAKICGLAVEKLDKVRFQAWCCLQDMWALIGVAQTPQK